MLVNRRRFFQSLLPSVSKYRVIGVMYFVSKMYKAPFCNGLGAVRIINSLEGDPSNGVTPLECPLECSLSKVDQARISCGGDKARLLLDRSLPIKT